MKINLIKLRLALLFVALVGAFLVFGSDSAFAATKTWTGGGSDNKFSTVGNWSPSGAPTSGDTIVIPVATAYGSCSAEVNLENDLNTSNIALSGLSFTGSIPLDCYEALSVVGNTINIGSGTISKPDESYSNVYIKTNVSLSGSATLSDICVGVNGETKNINTGSHTLTYSVNQACATTFSGSGNIIATDRMSMYFSENSNYTGIVTLNGSAVLATDAVGIGGTNKIILNGSSHLAIMAPDTFTTPVEANTSGTIHCGSTINTCGDDLVISSPITLLRNLSFDPEGVKVTVTGALTGSYTLGIKSGSTGSLVINSSNNQSSTPNSALQSQLEVVVMNESNKSTYCLNQDNGMGVPVNKKYIWNIVCPELGKKTGPVSPGSEFLNDGLVNGILAGTGSIGSIKIMNGGVVAPGNSPGTLTVANLSFEEGGVYEFEVAGSGDGQYDQIRVTGTVNLGNGTLSTILLDGYKPETGKSFVIIRNDGEDAIEGTFANLTQGATVEIDGVGYFTISYTGGDGNDVELTAIPGVSDTGAKGVSAQTGFIIIGAVGAGVVFRKLNTRTTLFKKRR